MQTSYGAFKDHALLDLSAAVQGTCASFRQQQRLLRVHLRHLLLTSGDEAKYPSRPVSGIRGGAEDITSGAAWMERVTRAVTTETREFSRQELQIATRRQRRVAPGTSTAHPQPQAEEDEVELPSNPRASSSKRSPTERGSSHREDFCAATSSDGFTDLDQSSTSQFISLEAPYGDTEGSTLGFSAQGVLWQAQEPELSPDSCDAHGDEPRVHPFELAVELLSARDLASSSSTARVYVGAELSLMHQARQIATLSAEPSAYIAAVDDMVHWDNAALRFGFDPKSEDSMSSDPQSVINEWSLSILVKVFDSGFRSADLGRIVGKLEVPLFLLETTLAQEYALVRWLPLERTAPGVPTRGDIRVSIAFSMREVDNSEGRLRMVAYKPNTSNVTSAEPRPAKRKQGSAPSTLRRSSRKPTAHTSKPQAGSKSNASPRRGSSSISHQSDSPPTVAGVSRTKQSQPLKKVPGISPSHQRPKVEAFSPPSSPSSFSSENLDEQPPRSRSPLQRQRRKGSLSSLAKAKQPAAAPVAGSAEINQDGACGGDSNSSSSSSQPFLKRKPYQVVFRKLDWSSVASRTDSSWDAKNPPATTATAGPRPPTGKTGTASATVPTKRGSKMKASNSQQQSDSTAKKPPSTVELNPVMASRLQTLSCMIYASCQVTQETASLAHMKYQSERNKYLLLHLEQVPSGENQLEASSAPSEASRDPHSEACGSILTSKLALSSLWKVLVKDASGELYAAKLQQLLSGSEHL